MPHRAFALPSRPLQSNGALRVTAARASDIVLADGQAVERDATAAPTDHDPKSSARPTGRRRRRSSASTGASR
jgi:hypothetical protein